MISMKNDWKRILRSMAFLQLLRRTTDPGGSHDDDSKHG